MHKPSKTQTQKHPSKQASHVVGGEESGEEYEEMELLERLEALREEMEDLGVTTLAEVIRRIEVLHRSLDNK